MFLKFFRLAVVALLVWTTGSAAAETVGQINRRPLADDLATFQASDLPPEEHNVDRALSEQPTGVITLRQALSLALQKNPRLRSFAWDIRAKEALALQAGLLPNPEISVDIENFEGTGPLQSFNRTESTLQLSQLIELGGKRMKRVKIAELEWNLAAWDYEAARINTLTEVTKAFIDILLAQEQLSLASELVNLADRALVAASERALAGKAPPIDVTKAKVELSISRINFTKTKHRLIAARKRLAALWGSREAVFEKATGHLDVVKPIPAFKQVEGLISQNTDIARQETEINRSRAMMNLAKAKRIPDLTVLGGLRRFNETDDDAYVMGMSIPLPIFDRNQGAYREARFNLVKAEEKRRAVEARVRTTLSDAYQVLSSAYAEVTSLKKDIIPGAQTAFDTAREGYLYGKFSFLEVLDAQRVLFEARSGYIDALASYHKRAADVGKLIGSGLDAVQNTVESK